MTKRFEKERAEAETILSNYKKNLTKYFDNPTSYSKLVSALMPIMQEQIKLIDDFRDSSIEISVGQDITLGGLTGPKLIFGMQSFDPHYTTAYAKVATSGSNVFGSAPGKMTPMLSISIFISKTLILLTIICGQPIIRQHLLRKNKSKQSKNNFQIIRLFQLTTT